MSYLPKSKIGFTLNFLLSFWLSCLCSQQVQAQDITLLGGDLTSNRPINNALELPAPNVNSKQLFDFHLLGHSDFHGSFSTVRLDGTPVLGPRFNSNSCGTCHLKNGRGQIRFSRDPHDGSPLLVKVSLRGLQEDGTPRNVPRVGEQLQDHLRGSPNQFKIRLEWIPLRGRYADGMTYHLRKPKLSFDIPNVDERRVVTSIRMSPPVIGMGLLEAVPDQSIIEMSDPEDLDGDGISGRVSWVPNLESGLFEVGRFGFRATQPTLKQQTAAAFFHDMGITNSMFPGKGGKIEVSDEIMDRVIFYLRAPGVTPARTQNDPNVLSGKLLFQKIGCDGCHKITLRTSDFGAKSDLIAQVAGQEIHPFTDLLLHDMGPGLADKRPEFSASGREWRTTPLWGLGMFPVLSKFRPGFLHDGRARTIEEAILWHGGEADRSRTQFKHLSKEERHQLLEFLHSL